MARVARYFFKFIFLCFFAITSSMALAQKSISTNKLSLSSNLILKNNSVNFVSIVNGVNPTGSVVFYNQDGLILGQADLVNGVATFSKMYTATQSYQFISAMYSGDAQNEPSLSAGQTFIVADTIGPAIQITPNQVIPGQPFAISISGLGAYTRADFIDQWGAHQGTIYPNSQTNIQNVGVPYGPRMFSASFSGNTGYTVSQWVKLGVNATPERLTNSEISIYSETNPMPYNGYVTLKVQVLGNNPTGTVKITNGVYTVANVQLVNGVAKYTAYNTGKFSSTFIAEYSGDDKNTPSGSKSIAYKTTPLIKLEANPLQVAVGGNVTITASLTGYNVMGVVQFMEGGTVLKTMDLTRVTSDLAVATFSTSFPKSSTRRLYANYIGSSEYSPVSSPVVQVVVGSGKSDTSLSLSTNPSSIYVGQDVWLNASISGDAPTGSVQFFDGGSQLGITPINASLASFSVKLNSAGVHSLNATYPGDVGNAASTSNVVNFTVKDKNASTTSLSVNPSPIYAGQSVVFSAIVTGSGAGGTVSFLDGSTTLSTKTLVNGATSFTTSSLTQGTHTLSAIYGGDIANLQSKSANINLQVIPKTNSTVTVTASPSSALAGQNITLTATISGASPTGNVTFSGGSWTLGSAPVINGAAVLVTNGASYLNVGTNAIGAVYSGDTANNWSVGATNLILKDGNTILENYVVDAADINQDGCVDFLVRTKEGTVNPIFLLLSGQNCSYSLNQPVSPAQATAAWQPAAYKILVGDTVGDSHGSLLLVPQNSTDATVFNIQRMPDHKSFNLLQYFKASSLFNDTAAVTLNLADVDGDNRTDLAVSVSSGVVDVYGAQANGNLNFNEWENRVSAAKLTWKNFLNQTNANSVDGALNLVDEDIQGYMRTAMTMPGVNLAAFASTVKQFVILADEVPNRVRAAVIFDTTSGSEEMFVIGFGKNKDGVWRILSM